ncbi:hypothetical protein PsYK624_046240 [Phanerochaete sordida]|uniref:BTB domain-containing protein n=1 Tax=Phanerochaete sordida TaxID=48140 RepID=A0A9P3LAL4_9APHY|nr:hypothetical protein PsYK624_046240 [Phanerochaete sordida]
MNANAHVGQLGLGALLLPSQATPDSAADVPISNLVDSASVLAPAEAAPDLNEIAVSSRFYPGSLNSPPPQDLVLVTTDQVFFFVQSAVLLAASRNFFANCIIPQRLAAAAARGQHEITCIHETSIILNIVLHAIYDFPCEQFGPTNHNLIATVDTLAKYGLSVQTYVTSPRSLFNVLASRIATDPLQFYALAGHHDLYALASRASVHLVGHKASDIPMPVAERMGPIYLNRLLALHQARQEALKAILRAPPAPHPPTDACGADGHAALARAWSFVAAYLIWEMRPDMTTISLELTVGRLSRDISCPLCKTSFHARLAEVIAAWASVPRCI